ncbi:FMRFamide-activated amiloride-sensitive sodium channel [Caerostris extrusa]|uniref:FMRFamide-activated amiloride-sensitive sodium channel n=1 Tax=Caerostris extrusa TaxID=172846 RepID=A0AAV4MX65_CAEEX|nr:FMRFamide-activated amiloride-sensitive sodium channel [Caerostris extrusa]
MLFHKLDILKRHVEKITWIAILTGAWIGCCYQIYGFLDQYFKYPVIVDLLMEQLETITFPAVTICNLNRMKSEYEPCLYNIDALEKCRSQQEPDGSVGGSLSLSNDKAFAHVKLTLEVNNTRIQIHTSSSLTNISNWIMIKISLWS